MDTKRLEDILDRLDDGRISTAAAVRETINTLITLVEVVRDLQAYATDIDRVMASLLQDFTDGH